MGAWELGNRISEISYKLDGIAGIAELVAEKIIDEPESGACWHVAEVIRQYGEELEALASDVMVLNKQELVQKTKKKKDIDIDGRC